MKYAVLIHYLESEKDFEIFGPFENRDDGVAFLNKKLASISCPCFGDVYAMANPNQ